MNSGSGEVSIPNNEIWYTSSDGKVVGPYSRTVFGAKIVSNTYENGKGVIKFDGPVTSIGEYAFNWGSSLTEITIPNSVTSFGYMAFYYCSSLTEITIPNSVTRIGESAFNGCSSLQNVYCERTTPPTGDRNMFRGNASDRKIYVPINSVNAYKSASWWGNYSSDIVGYNFN